MKLDTRVLLSPFYNGFRNDLYLNPVLFDDPKLPIDKNVDKINDMTLYD